MYKKLISLLVVLIFVITSTVTSYGATASTGVKVTLPEFKVTLNGVAMDNSYSKYPLIVYKDITYFPMTYSDCRFLGIETNWKGNEEGLDIDTTDITGAYAPYKTAAKNGKSYRATIPNFPIKINGETINNAKEVYPLLSFRDITYFPITWRFGVDEFGWDYSFDSKNGLTINSDNIHLIQTEVPNDKAEGWDSMAIADGYVYYVGTKGRIMKAEIFSGNSSGNREAMIKKTTSKVAYQLPLHTMLDGESYVIPTLYSEDGMAYLTYSNGGATMGTDYLLLLDSNGSTLINSSRNVLKSFGDKEFQWWIGPAPGPENLYMKTDDPLYSKETGYEGWMKIGDPDYLYGWNWKISDESGTSSGSQGGSGSKDCYLVGDNLYILGFNMKLGEEYLERGGAKPTTGIYKINIKTNETKRISDEEVLAFRVEGDYIYYHNNFIELFKYKISENMEYPIGERNNPGNNYIEDFQVLGGNIYFKSGVDHGLYNSKYDLLGWGVQELKLTGTNKEYIACTLSGNSQMPDRVMVFDNTGEKVFRSSDEASAITVEGDKVYYYNKSTNTVCVGDLGVK